jgi:hypothetical protein
MVEAGESEYLVALKRRKLLKNKNAENAESLKLGLNQRNVFRRSQVA